MVMYFAEKYACQYQEEVQSAHWHHVQVTIHPISTYYVCSNCDGLVNDGHVLISNDLTHNYHAVQNLISLRPCGLIGHIIMNMVPWNRCRWCNTGYPSTIDYKSNKIISATVNAQPHQKDWLQHYYHLTSGADVMVLINKHVKITIRSSSILNPMSHASCATSQIFSA